MNVLGCKCRCSCTLAAVIVSVIVGVIAAFLQIAGVITLTPVFLVVAFGIAVVYLGTLVLATALMRRSDSYTYVCPGLNTALAGILGTILFAVVLLAVGIVATSIVSAILVGILLLFFTLMLTGTACLVRAQADCDR